MGRTYLVRDRKLGKYWAHEGMERGGSGRGSVFGGNVLCSATWNIPVFPGS